MLFSLIAALAYFVFGKLTSHFVEYKHAYHQRNTLYHNLSNHNPVINWSDKQIIGCDLSEENKKSIIEAYKEAWFVWNKSMFLKDDTILDDYFSEDLIHDLKVNNSGDDLEVERINLIHNLEPYLFSLDRQVFAFKDRNVKLRKRLYHKNKLIRSEEEIRSYEVLMIFENGRWRIKQLRFSQEDSKMLLMVNKRKEFTSNQMLKENVLALHKVKGMNYYPKDSPWLKFWEAFDKEIIEKDFKEISLLGFNTIRIFIPNDGLVKENTFYEIIWKMESLLKIATKHKLRVIPTLFDQPASFEFDNYTYTERQLMSMLTYFKDNKTILAWDLKNEADLDFDRHGKQKVLEWLDYMIERARHYDPNHPLTIGWANFENTLLFEKKLDLLTFHYYDKAKPLFDVLSKLKSLSSKPIMLGEFGYPTNSLSYPILANKELRQAEYLSAIVETCHDHDVPFMMWTLHDFEDLPYQVFSWRKWIDRKQKNFGIKNKNGEPKLFYEMLLD